MTKIIGLKKERSIIKQAINENIPVLLIGETGTGKTSIIRELAQEEKQVFRRLNLNGNTGVDEFVGKMTLEAVKGGTRTRWQDGILVDAMKKGHWLLIDEINSALPEVLFVLQSLLDDDRNITLADNEGEVINPHKNFRLFSAMNPPADYAGTKKLNRALLSRFGVVLKFPLPSKDQMKKIVIEHVPDINEDTNDNICRLAEHINMSRADGSTDFFCSIRDVISFANMISKGNDTSTAFHLSILNKVDEHDEEAIRTVASLYVPLKTKKGAKMLTPQQREEKLIEDIGKELGERTYEVDVRMLENFGKQILKQVVENMSEDERKIGWVKDRLQKVWEETLTRSTIEKEFLDEKENRELVERHVREAYQRVTKENK